MTKELVSQRQESHTGFNVYFVLICSYMYNKCFQKGIKKKDLESMIIRTMILPGPECTIKSKYH